MRALKPEEKKTALNPSCGTKRKRKESAGPSVTKSGDNVNNSDDEYENPSVEGSFPGENDAAGKVYANFAQNLTPDQQRRFCGSLIDSYEFKEGGLMKKTISVKYQGTHHHVISYYSLEDVVSGKLKRPYQDPRLEHIQPRPELLTGWKVSLEDEESKDMPLMGYPPHIQPSHVQHHAITPVSQSVGPHGMIQSHGPPHLQVPEFWPGGHVQQYAPSHQSSQHYASPQPPATNNAPYQYPTQQTQPTQPYVQPPSPQPYPSPQSSSQPYPAPANAHQQFAPHVQASRHYSIDQQQPNRAPRYPPQVTASHYAASHHPQPTPSPSVPQYAVPSVPSFDVQVAVPQSATSTQPTPPGSVSQHDPQRRASAPVALQPYAQTPYHPAPPHPAAYYVEDAKYPPNTQHGY
ncbi:Gluconate transport-inducing protein required for gluconate-H+ symport [Didymella sp. IMI 355093]|nr:Gluconate transport-inducing protein required for gluconate-H+ symport [Didymella sp. IMI 355093]